MPMYHLIEHSVSYSKTSESLWQYDNDEQALDNNENIVDFPTNENNSISFKFKQHIIGQTENHGTKHAE